MRCNDKVLLHLSLIPGVGPASVFKLIRYLFNERYPDILNADLFEIIKFQKELDLERVYFFSVNDLVRKVGFSEKIACEIVCGLSDKGLLDKEMGLIDKNDIKTISFFDKFYPEILQQINLPPIILYCKGQLPSISAKRISVVGARAADSYARTVIDKLIPPIVSNGWSIVSGGAVGADTMAHSTTIDCGGRTVAVLGSGLLRPYPEVNISLFDRIADSGGAVVSAFPLMTQPEKGNFPARNRIIAGLSLGCVVVQARQRSGALITAQFALENGKQVFAVPGSVHHDLSEGCHDLIKQGAKIVSSAVDVLEEFNEDIVRTEQNRSFIIKDNKNIIKEVGVSSFFQDPVLQALSCASSLDELCLQTGFDVVDLQSRLFELQLEGKVVQQFTGAWERSSLS